MTTYAAYSERMAQEKAMKEREAALALRHAALVYLLAVPAYRTRPMGAPGSMARNLQDAQIECEDKLKKALREFETIWQLPETKVKP